MTLICARVCVCARGKGRGMGWGRPQSISEPPPLETPPVNLNEELEVPTSSIANVNHGDNQSNPSHQIEESINEGT